MIEQMQGMAWAISLDRKITYANKHYLEYFGFVDAQDAIYDRWTEPLHPSERDAYKAIWQKACETGEGYETDWKWMRASDRSYRWVRTSVFPIKDENGNITYWVGFAWDIHEQKMSQIRRDHLQEISLQLAQALTFDEVVKVIQTLGSKAVEARSTLVLNNESSIDAKVYESLSRRNPIYLEHAGAVSVLLPPQLQNGLNARSLISLPLVTGNNVNAVILHTYETEQRFDADFKSFVESLRSQYSQAIERARLYESEKAARSLAEEANKAKTMFVAKISHEFRTPLTAISGFAEYLAGQNISEERQRLYVERIYRNAETLGKLLDDILDVSRVESGQLTINPQNFDPKELLADVLSLFTDEAEKKGIRLSIDRIENLPKTFVSDPIRIWQILINVVGNAVKFTEKGWVKIEVREPANGKLEFLVHDSGVGLQADHIDRIFEPFGQADRSTRSRFGGNGLGLYISRQFAKVLRGDVTLLRTMPGQGSVFAIVLSDLSQDLANKPKSDLHLPPMQ